ncbi:hypothetical protein Ancab_031894 [Ancistrocladus abbreviatus]
MAAEDDNDDRQYQCLRKYETVAKQHSGGSCSNASAEGQTANSEILVKTVTKYLQEVRKTSNLGNPSDSNA